MIRNSQIQFKRSGHSSFERENGVYSAPAFRGDTPSQAISYAPVNLKTSLTPPRPVEFLTLITIYLSMILVSSFPRLNKRDIYNSIKACICGIHFYLQYNALVTLK